ncbi:hypothetical protein HMPREF9543_04495 [Escherichia coli MS 146-1]|nr:hypothetical protein HMPREF9543_04495 [Escherichia coli MS 146-1]ESE03354.1 hypothetical protein HMPREF1616_03399 [Escherichia coli 908658]
MEIFIEILRPGQLLKGESAQFFLTVTEKLAERFVGLQPLPLGAH